MRKECSLCGGKLRGNICTECGLDNSKNDSNYSTTKSHDDYEKLTHVHNKVKPLAGKTLTKEQRKQMQLSYTMNQERQSGTRKNKGNNRVKSGKITAILIIVFILIGAVRTVIDFYDVSDDSWGTGVEEVALEEDFPAERYDPYEYVTYDLPVTGNTHEEVLSAGFYIGGVHIPEGPYEVTVVNGYGTLRLEDVTNGIYQEYYCDETMFDEVVEADFRVYSGAHVEIEGPLSVIIRTTDAVHPIESMMNTNTDSFIQSEKFTVGTDVEPGVYDITCTEGEGLFIYTVELENDYVMVFDTMEMGSADMGYAETYKNIVLPEGTTVEIEGMTVQLLPSENIEDEEYLRYYEQKY